MAISPNLGEFPNFEICNFSKFGEILQIWVFPVRKYSEIRLTVKNARITQEGIRYKIKGILQEGNCKNVYYK